MNTNNEINIKNLNYLNFWCDNDYSKEEYICPLPTEELINEVELKLGYKLPKSYIWLMNQHNGGILNQNEYNIEGLEYWNNKIELTGIYGISEENKENSILNNFSINNNDLKDIGAAFCDTETAGHDIIFFDYRECGPQGEPKISHMDNDDKKITVIADNFTEFINKLINDNKNKQLTIVNNDSKQEQIKSTNNKTLKKIKTYTIILMVITLINILLIFPNIFEEPISICYIIFMIALLIIPLYGLISNIILVNKKCNVKNKMKKIKIISSVISYTIILTSSYYIKEFTLFNVIIMVLNIVFAILLLSTNKEKNEKGKKCLVYIDKFNSNFEICQEENVSEEYKNICINYLVNLPDNVFTEIYCSLLKNYNYYKNEYNDENLPKIINEKDILNYISDLSMVIYKHPNQNIIGFCICGNCKWNEENGFIIVINDNKTVYCGENTNIYYPWEFDDNYEKKLINKL